MTTLALPDGPKGKLRSTYRVLRSPFEDLPRWQQRYGDPFTIPTVNGTVVMTGDPALVKQIFAADPDIYGPWAVQALGPTVGKGSMLIIKGERHTRERKLLMPAFHGERMRAYAELMSDVAARRFAAVAGSPRYTTLSVAQGISLEVIVRAVFGANDDARVEALSAAVLGLVEGASPLLFFMPFLQRDFGGFGPWARFRRAYAILDTMLQEQVDRARAADPPGVDMCSVMAHARYEDGAAMSDTDIRDELRTLLFAGHETTAITIAWIFEFLHRDPALLERVRAEVDGAAGDPEAYAKLELLDAVCKEALRLYPVVTEVLRVLEAPLQLGEIVVPAGIGVSAGILLVHRREELYPEPLRFRAERFLERRFSPFEYLPFGGGHRRCLGAAFASFEMKIVVATALA
ncbi:MAG: cytochrome P450, partial [Deltaproteobacteria bacterium]|nr:cytochrome P450 [Nannocystaceae bacterium]